LSFKAHLTVENGVRKKKKKTTTERSYCQSHETANWKHTLKTKGEILCQFSVFFFMGSARMGLHA